MLLNSNEYLHTVEAIKQEIRTAQYKAHILSTYTRQKNGASAL